MKILMELNLKWKFNHPMHFSQIPNHFQDNLKHFYKNLMKNKQRKVLKVDSTIRGLGHKINSIIKKFNSQNNLCLEVQLDIKDKQKKCLV